MQKNTYDCDLDGESVAHGVNLLHFISKDSRTICVWNGGLKSAHYMHSQRQNTYFERRKPILITEHTGLYMIIRSYSINFKLERMRMEDFDQMVLMFLLRKCKAWLSSCSSKDTTTLGRLATSKNRLLRDSLLVCIMGSASKSVPCSNSLSYTGNNLPNNLFIVIEGFTRVKNISL